MFLIVSNPSAGKGKALTKTKELRRTLSARAVSHHLVALVDKSLSQAIKELPEPSAIKGIFVIGGDGTVHYLIQALKSEKIDLPIAVISAGSGNDFSRALNLHNHPIEQIVDLVTSSEPQAIDLLEVNGHWIAQILSTGFDAQVNRRANSSRLLRGKIKYTLSTLREILSLKCFKYEVVIDSVQLRIEGILLGISNGGNYGGGLQIVPSANQQDGMAELFFVKPISKLKLLFLFPKVFRGSHINHPDFVTIACKEGAILGETLVYGDGEPLPSGFLDFRIVPKAIRVWRL